MKSGRALTDFTLVGELPRHLYVFVDAAHTHTERTGFVPALWYGLVSLRARVWGCTVIFESGAVYRNIPPHAIAFYPEAEPNWTVQDAQRWDCYGERFSTIEYRYLAGLEVLAHCNSGANSKNLPGTYLFTAAPVADGFSMAPEQAKEFSFIALDNGRLTIQPTNHVLFRERSFTTNQGMEFPLKDLKRQTEVWSCE
jgi:hypothetical protein